MTNQEKNLMIEKVILAIQDDPKISNDVYDFLNSLKKPIEQSQKQKVNDFTGLCKPIIKYLCDNYHPHVTVLITPTRAELVEGIMSTPVITEFIKD
jgi:hypothetical protein